MTTLAYILLALAAGFALGRYRSDALQNRGEALLARSLSEAFRAPDYHLMNHITLPLGSETTQIDHILVSRFGVFVIETKDYKGWLFGNPQDKQWTQVVFKRKFKFQNPLFQNRLHVRAVEGLLDFLPSKAVRSVVVFTGDAVFKTPIPEGVCQLRDLVEQIRGHTTEVLSHNRLQFCVGRLEATRLAITRATDVAHVQRLQRKRGGA